MIVILKGFIILALFQIQSVKLEETSLQDETRVAGRDSNISNIDSMPLIQDTNNKPEDLTSTTPFPNYPLRKHKYSKIKSTNGSSEESSSTSSEEQNRQKSNHPHKHHKKSHKKHSKDPHCSTLPEIWNSTKDFLDDFTDAETWGESFSSIGRSTKDSVKSLVDCGKSIFNGIGSFLGLNKKRSIPADESSDFTKEIQIKTDPAPAEASPPSSLKLF